MSTLAEFAKDQRAITRARQLSEEAARAAQAARWAMEREAPVVVERTPPKPRKTSPRAPKAPDTLDAVARDLRRLAARLEALLDAKDGGR